MAGPRSPSRVRSEWVASSTATASRPKPAPASAGSSSRRAAGMRASQACGEAGARGAPGPDQPEHGVDRQRGPALRGDLAPPGPGRVAREQGVGEGPVGHQREPDRRRVAHPLGDGLRPGGQARRAGGPPRAPDDRAGRRARAPPEGLDLLGVVDVLAACRGVPARRRGVRGGCAHGSCPFPCGARRWSPPAPGARMLRCPAAHPVWTGGLPDGAARSGGGAPTRSGRTDAARRGACRAARAMILGPRVPPCGRRAPAEVPASRCAPGSPGGGAGRRENPAGRWQTG